jgi:hypothetical protein
MNAVKYEGDIKDTVDAYNALDKDSQAGDYWDKTDVNIQKVKKHIKDHYKVVQDYTCVYCQQKVLVTHGMAWDTEHIIPKKSHPQFLFTEENLALVCKDCNLIKSDKNVLKNPKRKTFTKKAKDYIIVHPHFDVYDEYIQIIAETIYRPKDEKGKETIEVCGLLRFAFEFGNNENIAIDTEKLIQKLTNELMNSSNSDKYMILGIIADIAKKGQENARNDYLKNL